MPRILFRIVRTNPPSRRDLMSHAERGTRPLRPLSQREADLWNGVSMYDSLEAAVGKARSVAGLGSFIARVEIPDDADVRIEQTGREREHHTVWAPAALLRSWIADVASSDDVV